MAPKFRPGQTRFVVPQVGDKIDEGLDADADATLKFVPLTPQYSVASLNYIIDRHARIGSTLSLSMFWSMKSFPIFISINVLILAIRLSSQLKYNHWYNLLDATNFMQFMIFLTASLASSLLFYKRCCWYINEELDQINETGDSKSFNGASLKSFAVMDTEDEYLKLTESGKLPFIEGSQVALYRNVPIGIVSVQKDNESQEKEHSDKYVISAMAVKYVYIKAGLYIDLSAWAINYVKKKPNRKNRCTFLEIEIYDFEDAVKQALLENGFKCIATKSIDHKVIGQYFGHTRSVYRYTF